jgi:UDP-N-acetylglucosamine--N-acetylmuramyl-(pentapeptide) pyrophosphoryl-undecaprenol N-acetylglucosamine transferase
LPGAEATILNLLVAGGGTGGHVFPALAIAREWMSRGADRSVVFAGTARGLETKLVPAAGLPLELIRSAGWKGLGGLTLARNLSLLPLGLWDSAAILRRHKFAAAFGVGGYAAGPLMLAAIWRNLPTVILEPNAEPGFTNRVLAAMVTRVATAYAEPAERLGRKAVLTGCPVRAEFFRAQPVQPAAPFRLLVTGGSQGARAINRAVVGALDLLAARWQQLSIVHQTGPRDYNDVRAAYEGRDLDAEVVPFIGDMAERFAQAHLIVSRAGAITSSEIAAAGRAAIFIPFGAAADSHQLRNAQEFERAGAARLIPESALSPEHLAQTILFLLDRPQQLVDMGARARAMARPDAARDVVDVIEHAARLGGNT